MPKIRRPKNKSISLWLKMLIPIVAVGLVILYTPLASTSLFNGFRSDKSCVLSNVRQLPYSTPVLDRIGYTVAYDGRAKTALWVYEELTRNSLKGDVGQDQFHFTEDPDIPQVIRSIPEDYEYSGFDGGHLAPAGDHKASEIQMEQTFYLSNIAPQLAAFNRGYWGTFEDHVRYLANEYDIVRVVTGPLYLPYEASDGKKYVTYEVIGDNNVSVPTHFFKVITAEKGLSKKQWAYIMPNEKIHKDTPLSDFQTAVDKVEKVSGIIFQK